jgi:hypothetical protein
MSKYNSRKTTVDGITFDSKKEARRYLVLKQMEQDGEIKNLRLQVQFQLIPSFEIVIDGKKRKRRPITYVADFVYYKNDKKVIEDVKGLRTPVYKIKKKLFEYRYHETIREV